MALSYKMPLDKRIAILDKAADIGVTIDGAPARIRGGLLDYPLVCRADGKGGDIEFSWFAVERVVNSTGAFKS